MCPLTLLHEYTNAHVHTCKAQVRNPWRKVAQGKVLFKDRGAERDTQRQRQIDRQASALHKMRIGPDFDEQEGPAGRGTPPDEGGLGGPGARKGQMAGGRGRGIGERHAGIAHIRTVVGRDGALLSFCKRENLT